MIEEWKDIKGYKGHYMISDRGRVKSLKFGKTKILNSRISKNGYDECYLSIDGKGKQVKVHRLVLQHFLLNPENKPHVNHINSKRDDNRLENLEWCTNKENMEHAWKFGYGTIEEAQRRRNITQRFNANVKYKKLQGQQFGSILVLGNITFVRGNITADTKCLRCGTIKHKNIRAELKGKTRMCLSCKNKSMGRLQRHTR